MRTMTLAVAAVLAIAAAATPATADEYRAGAHRAWRGPAYAGHLSRNVITPWYVGYNPYRYSYYRPTPSPLGSYNYPRVYRDGCWVSLDGDIFWSCW